MQARIKPLGLMIGLATLGPLSAQAGEAVKELGQVRFARDLDATLATAPRKPVFLLFQEVPG